MVPREVPLVLSAIPAAAALIAYLVLCPGVSGDKDASEFTLVLATGGAAHPTGYPLYVLFGHLFVSLARALGATPAYAANAWSAVGGAVAVFALHALATRLIPADAPLSPRGRFTVALLPTVIFALNPMWTYETTLAEVYSWHVAWALCCALYFITLARALAGPPEGDRRRLARHALGWGLLCGVGAAHHLTSALVSLPLSLALVAIAARVGVGARLVGLSFAGALLPLASYGFVAVRAFYPAAWQWETLAPTWGAIFDHVTGAAYRHYLGRYAPSAEQQVMLARDLYPVLALGALGALAAVAWARAPQERWIRASLGACVALGVAYTFSYGVPDPGSYFLAPLALALAALPAAGVDLAAGGAGRARVVRAAAAGLALVAAGQCVLGVVVGVERRDAFVALDGLVRSMWSVIPFEEAIVLFPGDMYTRLLEYQILGHEKSDLDIVNPWLLPHPVVGERFRARHGFDPFTGTGLTDTQWLAARDSPDETTRVVEALARAFHAHSPLPVLVFDLPNQSVRMVNPDAAR